MANISLSSSMVAVSNIKQQARFSFPVKFPFTFNVENLNNNFNENSSVIINSNLTGKLINIIPVSSNTLATTGLQGVLSNVLALSTLGLSGTSAIVPGGLISAMGLNGQLLSVLNMSAQTNNQMLINGTLPSITSLTAQSTSQVQIAGQLPSTSILSTTMSYSADLNSQVTSTVSLAAQANVQVPIVPQSINPTAVVTGITSAIFKLVTNIVANTSIACIVSVQNGINGDLISTSNSHGYLNNLIEGDLNADSSIIIPQTFGFPLEFPFAINDKAGSLVSIYSSVVGTSLIVNNSIQELLTVNLNGSSQISGNITCNFSSQGAINSNTAISSVISAKQDIGGQTSASSTVTGQIKEQLSFISSLSETSSMVGNLSSMLNLTSNVAASSSIVGDIQKQLDSGGSLTGNTLLSAGITQVTGLVGPITITSLIGNTPTNINCTLSSSVNSIGTINNALDVLQASYQADLNASSSLTGTLYKLISSDLLAFSCINIPQTFKFPLMFPFVINDKVNSSVAMSSTMNSDSSIINNYIQELITADLQGNAIINGNITCTVDCSGAVVSSTAIISAISSKQELSGQTSASSIISAQITEKMNICATMIESSTIVGNLTNMLTITSNVVEVSSILSNIQSQLSSGGNLNGNSLLSADVTQTIGLIGPISVTSSVDNTVININSSLLGAVSVIGTISNAIDALQVNCQGSLTSDSTINGDPYRLIDSNLSASGNIVLPQTFDFPMTFPLVFNNNLIKTISVSCSINAVSSIIDNSVCKLITVDLQSNSIITGTNLNKVDLQGFVNETSGIELTNQIATMKLCGQLQSTSSISAAISLNLDLSEVVSVDTTCNASSTLQGTYQGSFISSSTITGSLYNLVCASLNIDSEIILPQTLRFPLAFPVGFKNKILKEVALYPVPITGASLITGDINKVISSNVQSSSSVTGTIINDFSLHGSVISTSNITEIATDIIYLTGDIQCSLVIENTSIKSTIKLTGNSIGDSTLKGTVFNNTSVTGQITVNSTVQATINRIYLISLVGTFLRDINSTVTASFENLTNYNVANSLSTASLQFNVPANGIMQSNEQIEGIFNCTKTLDVQAYSESETTSMVPSSSEKITLNLNENSTKVLNLSEISEEQFTKVLINTKF